MRVSRWHFIAGSFVGLGAMGSCAVWMAHPPMPPNRPVYTVCHATGFHNAAEECGASFKPPGAEPGTFAPGDGPQPAPTVTIPGQHHLTDTSPQPAGFQGTPDIGQADVGVSGEGSGPGD